MSDAATVTLDPSGPIPPSAQPERIAALVAAVRDWTTVVPDIGVVLGSGLGGLADEMEEPVAIPFDALPGWPAATLAGCWWGASAVARWSCSRAASTSTKGTIQASSSNRCCCSVLSEPGSWC